MNGVDAVVLATMISVPLKPEYTPMPPEMENTRVFLMPKSKMVFYFWLEIPLALGTVGGLTSLHPLVKLSLEMLEKPSAKELMQFVAVAGLAQILQLYAL
jgi:hydroxymethylglutaryl-CoA reductase